MKKHRLSLLLVFIFSMVGVQTVFAGAITNIPTDQIGKVEMTPVIENNELGQIGAVAQVQSLALNLLHTVKIILSGLAVILMVYLGITLIVAL